MNDSIVDFDFDEPTQPGYPVPLRDDHDVNFELNFEGYPRFGLDPGGMVALCYLCGNVRTSLQYLRSYGDRIFCCPACAMGAPMGLPGSTLKKLQDFLQTLQRSR